MSNNPRSDRPSGTDPFLDKSDIVGMNEDVDKIVNVLTNSENDEYNLVVTGMVGMAGMGKTTIAQIVYKNEKVLRYFDRISWVYVSENFSVEKILNKMVQSLTGTIFDLAVVEAIVQKLKEVLLAKRFLLVLDDVWNEDAEKWNRLKNYLREIVGSKGSKILVTARSERVVSIIQATFTHQLGILSDDNVWKLFEKIAFGHCAYWA